MSMLDEDEWTHEDDVLCQAPCHARPAQRARGACRAHVLELHGSCTVSPPIEAMALGHALRLMKREADMISAELQVLNGGRRSKLAKPSQV